MPSTILVISMEKICLFTAYELHNLWTKGSSIVYMYFADHKIQVCRSDANRVYTKDEKFKLRIYSRICLTTE